MSDDENKISNPQETADWMNIAIESAKKLKNAAVGIAKKHGADTVDIPVMLTGYRDSLPVVSVVATEMNDDVSLTVGLLLTGCECDQITVISEGYGARQPINPLTGSEWEPRDMQYLFESEPELAKEAMFSAVFVHLIARPDHVTAISKETPCCTVVIPYEEDKESFKFSEEGLVVKRWFEDEDELSIPGTKFFMNEEPMRMQLMRDIEEGNAPITIWDLEDMSDDFGIDLLVDIFTVKQLNGLESVKAAGLMFPKESPRYEIFERLTNGSIGADPFEALGITAQSDWKIRKIRFDGGVATDESDPDL